MMGFKKIDYVFCNKCKKEEKVEDVSELPKGWLSLSFWIGDKMKQGHLCRTCKDSNAVKTLYNLLFNNEKFFKE